MEEDLSALLSSAEFQPPSGSEALELANKELVMHTKELLTMVAVHEQEALAKVNLRLDLMLFKLDHAVRNMSLADWCETEIAE
jgi:hypothetical protein